MLIRIINKIKREIKSFFISLFLKRSDRNEFYRIYREEREYYRSKYSNFSYPDYLVPNWRDSFKTMNEYFLNGFDIKFLRHTTIGNTMFVADDGFWKKTQIEFLESKKDKIFLKRTLEESEVGGPILTDLKYRTSTNSIHHLFHFVKFSEEIKTPLSNLKKIVEFGGGYGNAAKIFKRIYNNATYIIIDLPVFSSIQAVYLKTIFGDAEVVTADNPEKIKEGKINLIPIDYDKLPLFVDKIGKTDLFISTWALSEVSNKTQDLIRNLRYFDPKFILIAYQKKQEAFMFSEDVKNLGNNFKIIYNRETEYLKDNYYLFCEQAV